MGFYVRLTLVAISVLCDFILTFNSLQYFQMPILSY